MASVWQGGKDALDKYMLLLLLLSANDSTIVATLNFIRTLASVKFNVYMISLLGLFYK